MGDIQRPLDMAELDSSASESAGVKDWSRPASGVSHRRKVGDIGALRRTVLRSSV